MKKIDKEKSVVYSQWSDPVSLRTKGTFVNDFDRPDDYYYKYFVPRNTKVLVKEEDVDI